MIASVANAADNPPAGPTRLPTLYYAGVVPVQWSKNGPWKDLGDVRKAIDVGFPEAVRGSRRFVVLNDDLVRSLWATSNGRKELEADYEISAYISLDMSSKGDLAVMTVRLLSPKLETRLQESDVVSRATLVSATKAQMAARLSDLVQRMINRLPIDAHVTSINGGYVTLSGGSEQGIESIPKQGKNCRCCVSSGYLSIDCATSCR